MYRLASRDDSLARSGAQDVPADGALLLVGDIVLLQLWARELARRLIASAMPLLASNNDALAARGLLATGAGLSR